jgi:spore coat protein JC
MSDMLPKLFFDHFSNTSFIAEKKGENDSLAFLREREIVHSQRFREAVEILKEERDLKKFF